MNIILRFLLIFCVSTTVGVIDISAQYNDADSNVIHLADPTIFYYNGFFYLYGTVEGNTGEGFLVYQSTDLEKWKPGKLNRGFALHKGDVFGTANFWAPQVFHYHDKFYMAYVANENIAIATSESPLGPFVQKVKAPLAAAVKQIDPYIFIDDDGKKYLYHVRLDKGNNLYVAEMANDFSSVKPETLKQCIAATDPWENTAHTAWPVTEGPSILKYDNLYYLFYSANDFRNPNYAVGYATSKSPTGPWKKYIGNPIINKDNIGKNGTGHGDFVKDSLNNLFYVFHTHSSDSTPVPRKTAIIKAKFIKDAKSGEFVLAVDEGSFRYLKNDQSQN